MLQNAKGFTLIELMIVVVIIGLLAAVAIPNFISMQDRSREGSVKTNMHTVQLAIEDFAVTNGGVYPVEPDDADVEGRLPDGEFPKNPFTGKDTKLNWNAAPITSGDLGMNPAATTAGYSLQGFGKSALLNLTFTNGS